MTTKESVNTWFLALFEHINCIDADRIDYGLDCEWSQPEYTNTVVVYVEGSKAGLVDLYNAGILTPEDIPIAMKQVLEHPKMIPTGRSISIDVSKMNKLGITIKEWTEHREISLLIDPNKPTGLADIAERYLGIAMDKSGQVADYNVSPKLPEWLKQYAVIDGIMHLLALKRMRKILLERGKFDGRHLVEPPGGLEEGVTVQYMQRGSVKAIGEVTFIGGRVGQARKWGTKTIGAKLALVRLTEIKCRGAKPPYSYDADVSDPTSGTSWDKKDTTLADVYKKVDDPVIAVNTASLLLPLDDGQTVLDQYYPLVLSDQPEEASAKVNAPNDTNADEPLLNSDAFPLVLEIDEPDDESNYRPRSRSKEDIFHQFQNLPLKKDCPVRAYVSELNILATFRMDKEQYKAWAKHLGKNEGIILSADLINHFIHNKEKWRRHVPMYTPKADEHAVLIHSVHLIIQEDEELNKYYTTELQQYYEDFENKARRGYFEELSDVILHEEIGHDKYGLPVFIRKRGTVRAENVHQKMKVAIGPWGIGARSAHYLLVLLSYRYNVASNIRRRGYHNFGHCELYLIDRIQIRIREIYNVLIYPRQQNIMEFKPVDMVSVGIAPLTYDLDYVDRGPPHVTLRGDVRFVAEQTGLIFPLLPIASKEEIKIFTRFMLDHPQATKSNFIKLAKLYKEKSDGKTVFPKLPSMVKAYYNRWKMNQAIKASQASIGPGAIQLREALFKKSTSGGEVHGLDILKEVEQYSAHKKDDVPAIMCPRQHEHPTVHVHAPPLAAPAQKSPVPSHSINTGRRCAWFPFCKEIASICGGTVKKRCRDYSQYQGKEEDLARAKREMLNQERSQKYVRKND